MAGKVSLEDRRGLSSLDFASDADEWWRAWGPVIASRHGRQGWILFLLDANQKLQETAMLVSRLLRNKPEWNTAGWSQAEWENVEVNTALADSWFREHAAAPMKDAPDWAQYLFVAQAGNFAVLKRLGREMRAIQEQGYLVATLERRPGEGILMGGDAKEAILREAD